MIPLTFAALLVLVAGLLAVLISLSRVVSVPAGGDLSVLRVTTTRLLRARLAGLLAGLAASWSVSSWDGLGRGPMLAAPVLGIGLLLGTLAGELSAPRPHGPIRGASLEIRRARDYLPGFSTRLAGALTLVTVLLLSVTSVTASADDLGRAGRALAMTSPDGTVRSATTPWPGWFYAWPMLAVLAAAFLLSALVMHRVVQRGRPGLDAAARAVDDVQRAHTARVVTAAYGLCVALPLAGVAVVAAEALFRQRDFAGWSAPAAFGLLGIAVFAAGSATWYLAELLSRPTIRAS
ncbi:MULTISPECIES: hypothetical protein [unclassified Microbispora]|uniref:hypothetical protein n=1 Tax=unclassified Microbispora TaxID=2614687 RepID=UPI0014736F27|nr:MULTISPECIES: hypothetical protein [unclassified Microbispora]